jgi:hypothetical protein
LAKLAYFLIALLSLSILIIALSNAHLANAITIWGSAQNLSDNASYSLLPQIAISGDNVYVVWHNETPVGFYDIFIKRSSDGGDTWYAKKNLSRNAGFSSDAQIAVSGSNVHVVWQDYTPGNYDALFTTSSDSGATWSSVQNLSDNSGNSAYPKIAVSGSNVYVVWEDNTLGNYDVFFRTSSDSGATWSSVQNLSDNSGYSFDPKIAVSGSNVYVVWYDDTPGNFDVLFTTSSDSGDTWDTQNISSNTGYSASQKIAVSGSNVHVAWRDYTPGNSEIFSRTSSDSGATWGSTKNISDNASYSIDPEIAASGSKVYVAWSDDARGNFDIFIKRSSDSGDTWGAKRNLSKTESSSLVPRVAASGLTAYVAWWDDTSGNQDILLAESSDSGATWRSKNISDNSGSSFWHQIAISGDNAYVVWQDYTPGPLDILFKAGTITLPP